MNNMEGRKRQKPKESETGASYTGAGGVFLIIRCFIARCILASLRHEDENDEAIKMAEKG